MFTETMLTSYFKNTSIDCDSLHQVARCLGKAVDAKDRMTRAHSREVAGVACCLAMEIALPAWQVKLIHVAGHLHDIGKIGIPDKILNKPGPLSDKEWILMRQHPVIGAAIVSPIQEMSGATGIAEVILHHHERWDGQGYPHGLDKDKPSLGARIICLADSLSAMMQDRPYRKRLSFEQCLDEISYQAGKQFDPDLSGVMVNMISNSRLIGGAVTVDDLVEAILQKHGSSV